MDYSQENSLEPFTFQSKGRGFESPRVHHINGSSENLPLRDLLILLLGPEGRRRLELKDLTNDRLFPRYETELILRIKNPKNLKSIVSYLRRFKRLPW